MDDTTERLPDAVLQPGGDAVLQNSDLERGELAPDLASTIQTFNNDLEAESKEASHVRLDVEHAAVTDDPRLWTARRKV